MPNFDIRNTGEHAPHLRIEGRGIDPSQIHDVSGQWNRVKSSLNEDKYDYVLTGTNNRIYLARRVGDNQISICSYRVPKNIEAEEADFKRRHNGLTPAPTFMRAWIEDDDAMQGIKAKELDIYTPHNKTTPFIAEDINGDNKVYAYYIVYKNIETGEKDASGKPLTKTVKVMTPVQLEFMEKFMSSRYEQFLAMPEEARSQILMTLLKSYNTKQKIDRTSLYNDLLKQYGIVLAPAKKK